MPHLWSAGYKWINYFVLKGSAPNDKSKSIMPFTSQENQGNIPGDYEKKHKTKLINKL